jgi:NADH:ubiquinone oxidoreductase subunit 4 (subunit M)
MFYVCFESSLIPMFLLIGLFGSQPQGLPLNGSKRIFFRIYASYQFFLMTLAGSLFMLLGILILYVQTGTTNYILISTSNITPYAQTII